MEEYKPKKAERLISKVEDDSLMVFDPDSEDVHELNETAALIWNSITGNTTVKEIIDIVVEKNPDDDRQDVTQEVLAFLKELKELNLVE